LHSEVGRILLLQTELAIGQSYILKLEWLSTELAEFWMRNQLEQIGVPNKRNKHQKKKKKKVQTYMENFFN
jgi:hypothetical protein